MQSWEIVLMKLLDTLKIDLREEAARRGAPD